MPAEIWDVPAGGQAGLEEVVGGLDGEQLAVHGDL
jgi:hypothetical protein